MSPCSDIHAQILPILGRSAFWEVLIACCRVFLSSAVHIPRQWFFQSLNFNINIQRLFWIFQASRQFCEPSGTSMCINVHKYIYMLSIFTMGKLDISSFVASRQMWICRKAMSHVHLEQGGCPFLHPQPVVHSIVVTAMKVPEWKRVLFWFFSPGVLSLETKHVCEGVCTLLLSAIERMLYGKGVAEMK